jgi:hypothetical protein
MKNFFNGLASIVTSGRRNASDSALPAKRWFHTSEKAFEWTSDLQDLQADERPTDDSEMAKRWFKSRGF